VGRARQHRSGIESARLTGCISGRATGRRNVGGQSMVRRTSSSPARQRLSGLDHNLHFSHQNVLSGLTIAAVGPTLHGGRRLAVRMSGTSGMEAEFECARCTVREARPYDVSAQHGNAMSILDADDWMETIVWVLVKGPGYGLVRLINGIRGTHLEPGSGACWLAGIFFWAFLLGVGWIVMKVVS